MKPLPRTIHTEQPELCALAVPRSLQSGASRRWLGLALLLASPACNDAMAPSPMGVFELRAVRVDASTTVAVPGSVGRVTPNDTLRFVGGDFELGPNNRWYERWERVLISGSVETERRVFESTGTYAVRERTAAHLVLELYPGQILPAIIVRQVVLRGDTLHRGGFIFIR